MSHQEEFEQACRYGNLIKAQELYKSGNINVHAYCEWAFR